MRTVHNLPVLKERRKELRNKATPQETILWSRLKAKTLGFKFRRQHSIGVYIVDFCCPEKKLIVELDGYQHGEKDNIVYDEERTAYLHEFGYTILRFWNNEIDANLDGVLLKIETTLTTTPSDKHRETPPQLRRGGV